MIKIDVDLGWCQGNGLCESEAPDLFEVNDEGKVTFRATVDEDRRAAVEAAVTACPTQAVSMTEVAL